MTIPISVTSAPAHVPSDADAAALTLVLSHAEVAALRRQLAALIAPEPYGEGGDLHTAMDELRRGLLGGMARKL